MIKKLITCLLTCSVIFMFTGCEDDEVAGTPPKSALSVDETSGLVSVTEFTFTIQEVDADNVTLYPYGLAKADFGTVPVTFESGAATVVFKYAQAGVFEAVVVSNNHSDDGSSVKNSVSDAITMTITSEESSMESFTLDYITGTGDDEIVIAADSTLIDEGAGTIDVYVPYAADVTELTATFSSSPFSTVTANSSEQTSGEGTIDFTGPVTYTVTAFNGTNSTDYVVNVIQQAVETNTDVKSFSGTLYSINLLTDGKGKSVPGYTGNDIIVLYGLDPVAGNYDSVSVSFELDGKYATTALKQGDSLNVALTPTFTVKAEDETTQIYTVYGVQAPVVEFALNSLIPSVSGKNSDFNVDFDVLSQTSNVVNVFVTNEEEPSGVNITSYSIDGVPFTSGNAVDFSDGAVTMEVNINDTNIGETYTVNYTLNLLK